MPIGGGTFSAQNKVLPGAYINFVGTRQGANMGARGTAALPLALNWGPEDEIIKLDAARFSRDAQKLLGYGANAPQLLAVRECLKRALTVMLYRVNGGGQAATATVGGLEVTAKYSGTRGNDIDVEIESAQGEYRVITYVDMQQVDVQQVTAVKQLVPNNYVIFAAAAEGELAAAAPTGLTGGSDGIESADSHGEFLAKLSVESFAAVGYLGADSDTRDLYVDFVRRMRDTEGKKVVCVMATGDRYTIDHEGIIAVDNGVVLESGETVDKYGAAAWVLGATAAAGVNESLTNIAYDGAVDVDVKFTPSQYEEGIKAGYFQFYSDGSQARVVSDINTLHTFTADRPEGFASNRVMRVLDGWANDIARIFGASYIGRMTNDATSRELFRADLVSLGMQYQSIAAISEFDSDEIQVSQGSGKRDVVVTCALKPNDSMEKLYMTVTVS